MTLSTRSVAESLRVGTAGEGADLGSELLMSHEMRHPFLHLLVQPLSVEVSGQKLLSEARAAVEALSGSTAQDVESATFAEHGGTAVETDEIDQETVNLEDEVLASVEVAVTGAESVDGGVLHQTLALLARIVRTNPSDAALVERAVALVPPLLSLWDGTEIPDMRPLVVLHTMLEVHVKDRSIDADLLARVDAGLECRGVLFLRESRVARGAVVTGDLALAHSALLGLLSDAGPGATEAITWVRRQIAFEVGRTMRKSGDPGQTDDLWQAWDQFGLTALDRHFLLPPLLSGLAGRGHISTECMVRLTGIAVSSAQAGIPVDPAALERFILSPPGIRDRDDGGAIDHGQSEDPDHYCEDLALRLQRAALEGLEARGVETDRLRASLQSGSDEELLTVVRELRDIHADEHSGTEPVHPDPASPHLGLTVDGLLMNVLGPRIWDLIRRIRSGLLVTDLEGLRSSVLLLEGLRGGVSDYDAGWIVTNLMRAADADRLATSEVLAEAARLVVLRLRSGKGVPIRVVDALMKRSVKHLRRIARKPAPDVTNDSGHVTEDLIDSYQQLVETLVEADAPRLRRLGQAARLMPVIATGEGEDPIDLAEKIAAEHGHLRPIEVGWLLRQICDGTPDVDGIVRAGRLLADAMENGEAIHGSVLMEFLAAISRIGVASVSTARSTELGRVERRIIELIRAVDARGGEYGDLVARIELLGLQQHLREALERGDLDEMERAVASLRTFGPLGPYETGWLVEGLCSHGELERAVAVIEDAAQTPEAARGLTTYALMPVLRALSAPPVPNMKKAIELVELTEHVTRSHGKFRVEADAQMIQTLVTGYARAHQPAEAETLLREWTAARGVPIDDRHYGAILHGWGLVGDAERCERLIEEMRERDVRPTERHLQSVASAYARVGDLVGAGRTFEDAWRRLGRVSKQFIEIIALNFARSRSPVLGIEWAEMITSHGGVPEHAAFEVVAANCSSEDASRFESVLAAFEQRAILQKPEIVDGLVLSAAVSASLIPVSDRASLQHVIKRIEDLVLRARHGEVPRPSPELLARLAKNARSAEIARLVVSELEGRLASSEDPEPSASEIGPVLEVFSSFGEADECERLWARFVDPTRLPAEDAIYLYNVLISAHNRTSRPRQERIEELFMEMRSHGLSPDTFTVANLARAQDHLGAFDDESWMIFGRDAAALNRVVSLLDSALKELEPLFDEMDELVKAVDVAVGTGRLDEFRVGLATIEAQVKRVSERTSDVVRLAQDETDAQKVILQDIRHELNQPIMRMQVTVAVAEIDAENATELLEVGESWRDVKRQVKLAHDTLSRYSASIARADFREDCSVQEIISAALQSVRDESLALVDVQVSLTRDRFRPDLRVLGNKFLLTRAFWALFTNAVQAMADDGTPDRKILVRGVFESSFGSDAAPFGKVIITVEDNGPGISDEVRDRLMESGVTSKPQRGLGLGLAMVQSVVNAHQGSVFVDQQRGRGAYFQIGLPAAAPLGRTENDWQDEHLVGRIVRILPSGSAGFIQEDSIGVGGLQPAYYCSMPGGLPPLDTRVTFRIEQRLNRARGIVEPRAFDVQAIETGASL